MYSSARVAGQLSFDGIRSVVEGVTTTEGRLVVSGVVVALTVVLAALVVPALVRAAGRTIRDRLLTDRAAGAVDTVSDYIPTTVTGFVLRIFQGTLVVVGLLAVLVVWGLLDVVVLVVETLTASASFVGQFVATAGLVLGAYVAAKLLEDAVEQFSDGADRITDHQQEIVLRVGHLGIIAFTVAGGLTVWGIDLSGLLVGAGFLGIVVGLAARQTLGSMIAGFVLMFSRPFTIGDWVEIGDEEGIVTDITIMNTRLKNFDGEAIVIPNDSVSNKPITNRSEQGHLRIRIDVGIDYEADIDHAGTLAVETMKPLDSVADTPPPQVVPKAFGDSAIVLEIRFWIDRPMPPLRWHATKEVVSGIKEAFEREGIKIPYPQRELSGRAETGGFRVHGEAIDSGRTEDAKRDEIEPEPED